MRVVLSLFACAALATAALPAAAQTSAADIIKSLKPTGAIGSGTRGIRQASPAPDAGTPASVAPAPVASSSAPAAPRPMAAAAAARPVQAAPPAAAPSVNLEVQFATDSAELTPQARAALDQLGRALSSADLANYRFRIEGHTDTVGSADHNQTLSSQRADAVVAYLAGTYHIDRARMQPVGLGEGQLAVPTGQQVAEPRNRRVQVVNLGA